MGYFLSTTGVYYEGDQIDPLDAAVPKRPAFTSADTYAWNGTSWIATAIPNPNPSFTPSGQSWQMGTDDAGVAMYAGDTSTFSANQAAFNGNPTELANYLASSFTIQDAAGNAHAMTVAAAIPIYAAYWTYWQAVPGV